MNFYVGQKVVCVDDQNYPPAAFKLSPAVPTKNSVYTIRDVLTARGEPLVRLEEIVCEKHDFVDVGFVECAWWARRFRPLVERKTSIELLTSIRPDTPIVGPEIERELFKQKERA